MHVRSDDVVPHVPLPTVPVTTVNACVKVPVALSVTGVAEAVSHPVMLVAVARHSIANNVSPGV
jgi:hypothetical protein